VSAGCAVVSVCAGSAWYASRSWRAERALGLGGRAGGGPGLPGNPGLWGGFPGFPWHRAGFQARQVRRGMRDRCCALSPVTNAPATARFLFAPSRSLMRRVPPVLCAFPGHLRGGVCRAGEAGMGVWGKTWNRAMVFRGRGGSGFSPSAFPDWSPLLPVYSCSRAVPDLALCLVGGVRSGTWRRRGASASAQAGGGTETETHRAAPAHVGAALYGRCAPGVRLPCGDDADCVGMSGQTPHGRGLGC
jgi:hypothetical protein